MNKKLILVHDVCQHYAIEISFINELHDVGLLEIIMDNNNLYILKNTLPALEKMMRLNIDLEINAQGIDIVFNLLNKIHAFQKEIKMLQ
jgi:hypothetical protein